MLILHPVLIMRKILYTLLVFMALSSCSEYQKVLKAEGEGAIAKKFKMGEELYDQEKYEKANRLFAQIVPEYRGKPQAEKLMYLYSNSFYKMKDYYVAGYQFERFASSYPNSEKVEEASFLSAKSYYMLSPAYTKDQTETKDAIEKLQGFINLYTESEYLAEANQMVKDLEYKLEKKAYSIAKQYNHISDYPASIKSFENFIFEFPGSTLREDALFYKLDSAYKLAVNSVDYKKEQRLKDAKVDSDLFLESYASSKYIEDVKQMASDIENQLKSFKTES